MGELKTNPQADESSGSSLLDSSESFEIVDRRDTGAELNADLDFDAQETDLSPHGTIERSLEDLIVHLIQIERKIQANEDSDDGFVIGSAEESTITDLWNAVEGHAFKPVGFAKPEALDCIKSIRSTLLKGADLLYTIPSLLMDLRSLLRIVRPVNLHKLFRLLEQNHQVPIEGKDVILLLGNSGAGKTTSLLFLGGVEFEGVEVNGFDHLQAVSFPETNPQMQTFATSCGTKSVTCALQSIEVQVDDKKNLVICDTPGFFHTDDVEMDIANGLGVVREIQKAKSVKPVLVFSREGMGDRFQAVADALVTVTRMLGSSSAQVELKAFHYVFAKYADKYQGRLAKQFQAMRKQLGPEERNHPLFVALVDDIIAQTTPSAIIVDPVHGDVEELLQNLHDGDCLDPSLFVPFMTEAAGNKLRLQMMILQENLEKSLEQQHYEYAAYCMERLLRLGDSLPELRQYAAKGIEVSQKHILEMRGELHAGAIHSQDDKDPMNFNEQLLLLRNRVDQVVWTEPVRLLCMPNELDSDEYCQNIIEDLVVAIGQCVPEIMFVPSTAKERIPHVDTVLRTCSRLDQMNQIFPEAETAFSSAIGVLIETASLLLDATETQDMSTDYANLGACAKALSSICRAFEAMTVNVEVSDKTKSQEERFNKLKLWFNSSVGAALGSLVLEDTAELGSAVEYRLMALLELDVKESTQARQYLVEMCAAQTLFESLSGMDRAHVTQAIEMFEESFVGHIREMVSCLQTMLENLMQSQKGEEYNRAISEYLAALRKAVAGTHERMEMTRGWSPKASAMLEEDLKRLYAIESALNSYASRSASDRPLELMGWAEVGVILAGLAAFALVRR